MTWEMRDPLGDALSIAVGGAASMSAAKRQRQLDDAAAQRQAGIDKQDAAYKAALTAQSQAATAASTLKNTPVPGFNPGQLPTSFKTPIDGATYYFNEGLKYRALGQPEMADAYFKVGNGYATAAQHSADAIYIGDPKTKKTQADTGLTNQRTNTEKHKPALIDAQAKNQNDLPESRARHDQDELTRSEIATQAAAARQAASIAAAFDRLNISENNQNNRFDRGLNDRDRHFDRTENDKNNKSPAFNTKAITDIAAMAAAWTKQGLAPHVVRQRLKTMYHMNDQQAHTIQPDPQTQLQGWTNPIGGLISGAENAFGNLFKPRGNTP